MTLFADLWKSFLEMPLWVRVWVVVFLGPVNLLTVAFIGNPGAIAIMSLACSGIAFNLIPILQYRGFTIAMAVPHVIFWVPLIVLLIYKLYISEAVLSEQYRYFLVLVLVCDTISLTMDIPDSIRWFRQKR